MYVEGVFFISLHGPSNVFNSSQEPEIYMEQLFSAKEVCEIFKISAPTLSRWTTAGQFPAPHKIYPHSNNRWTQAQIDKVFETMPIADAYKNSGYHETHPQHA